MPEEDLTEEERQQERQRKRRKKKKKPKSIRDIKFVLHGDTATKRRIMDEALDI